MLLRRRQHLWCHQMEKAWWRSLCRWLPCGKIPESFRNDGCIRLGSGNTVIAGLASNGITTTEYVYNSRHIVPPKKGEFMQSTFTQIVRGNFNSPDNMTIVPTSIYKEVCHPGQLPFAVNLGYSECIQKLALSSLGSIRQEVDTSET